VGACSTGTLPKPSSKPFSSKHASGVYCRTSDEHFTVDGTLLEAWASVKSFPRKDGKPPAPPYDPGNPTVDFHGEKRSNQTHESKTRSWRAKAKAKKPSSSITASTFSELLL
jgi:hypothetical protein